MTESKERSSRKPRRAETASPSKEAGTSKSPPKGTKEASPAKGSTSGPSPKGMQTRRRSDVSVTIPPKKHTGSSPGKGSGSGVKPGGSSERKKRKQDSKDEESSDAVVVRPKKLKTGRQGNPRGSVAAPLSVVHRGDSNAGDLSDQNEGPGGTVKGGKSKVEEGGSNPTFRWFDETFGGVTIPSGSEELILAVKKSFKDGEKRMDRLVTKARNSRDEDRNKLDELEVELDMKKDEVKELEKTMAGIEGGRGFKDEEKDIDDEDIHFNDLVSALRTLSTVQGWKVTDSNGEDDGRSKKGLRLRIAGYMKVLIEHLEDTKGKRSQQAEEFLLDCVEGALTER
ncbi:hypothetical protein P7C70_g9380, partial [Phenoliferia sp. Uapishka_3]